MEQKPDTNLIDQRIQKATQCLSQSLANLKKAGDICVTGSKEQTEMQSGRALQLLLQYRLDAQDTLVKLLQFERAILQILGIEPQSSASVNLERMAFALGHEDLHQLLSTLNQLLGRLLRVAYHEQHSYEHAHEFKLQNKSQFDNIYQHLQKSSYYIKQFAMQLTESSQLLELWYKYEAIGPVHDHIAALRGPISRFYQLLLSGIEFAYGLYKKLNHHITYDLRLDNVLCQSEALLHHWQEKEYDLHLFKPPQANVSKDTLEKRAEKRRLINFFHH